MSARDEAFAAFVRADRRALVRFATTLTGGDAHLAEDLVQTALVKVYLANPSSSSGGLHGYVRRAVLNALIDHQRRPFTRRERSAPVLPERPAADADDAVDAHLLAALSTLPVRMRAAVVLRHVEGMSVDEAAAALGCTAGTVRARPPAASTSCVTS